MLKLLLQETAQSKLKDMTMIKLLLIALACMPLMACNCDESPFTSFTYESCISSCENECQAFYTDDTAISNCVDGCSTECEPLRSVDAGRNQETDANLYPSLDAGNPDIGNVDSGYDALCITECISPIRNSGWDGICESREYNCCGDFCNS